jgi:hypothetical protein
VNLSDEKQKYSSDATIKDILIENMPTPNDLKETELLPWQGFVVEI